MLKGVLFSDKFDASGVAEGFNSLFEQGELETDYGNRKNIAIDIFDSL